jgi:type IV pilus assembly protein PilM
MARISEDVVGLDIGAGELKVALVRDDQAIRIGHARLPEGIIIDGLLANPDALTRELKRIWRKLGLKSKQVNFGLANRHVQFRLQALPRSTNPDDLHLAITTNSETWFAPMRLDKINIDYAEQQAAEAGRTDLEICAADKTMVQSFARALRKAGLQPVACQYGPLSEARALSFQRDRVQAQVLVNIGAEKTSFAATNGIDVLFSRLIDIGGNDFTRAVAERLHMPFEGAERLKRDYGLNLPGEVDEDLPLVGLAQQALLAPTDRLVQALADMRSYYERQPSVGRPVSDLVLVGGGAHLSGLAEQISLYLGLPLQPAVAQPNFAVVPNIDIYAGAIALAWKRPMSLLSAPVAGSASKGPLKSKVDRRKADRVSRQLSRKQAAANPLLIGAAIGIVLMFAQYFYAAKLKKDRQVTPIAITQSVSFAAPVPAAVSQAALSLSGEAPPQVLPALSKAFTDVTFTKASLTANAQGYTLTGQVTKDSDVATIQHDLDQAPSTVALVSQLSGAAPAIQISASVTWSKP